jgi:hypothetical protein
VQRILFADDEAGAKTKADAPGNVARAAAVASDTAIRFASREWAAVKAFLAGDDIVQVGQD